MNKRYIDIDSGFRDRKIWPNPAEFGIQLAQTGTKYGIINAKNPITLAYPYYQWQWGCTSAAGESNSRPPATRIRRWYWYRFGWCQVQVIPL